MTDPRDMRITELEAEIARLREPRRDIIAPLAFGGNNCLCRERPSGGCDLIGCPHRKGGNWSPRTTPDPVA